MTRAWSRRGTAGRLLLVRPRQGGVPILLSPGQVVAPHGRLLVPKQEHPATTTTKLDKHPEASFLKNCTPAFPFVSSNICGVSNRTGDSNENTKMFGLSKTLPRYITATVSLPSKTTPFVIVASMVMFGFPFRLEKSTRPWTRQPCYRPQHPPLISPSTASVCSHIRLIR